MKLKCKFDLLLLVPVIALIIISLTTLLSINVSYFRSQLFALLFAFFAFFMFSQISQDFLRQLKVPLYILSLIILFIILIIGIESRGATRWVELFGIRIQFSEILKPFFALSFASYLSEEDRVSIKSFFLTICFLLPVIIFIFLQPDLGNALIYLFVVLFVLLIRGYPLRYFGLGMLPFLCLSPVLWSMLHDYQRQRLLTYLHPKADPLGASYNGIQAIIAVGSGAFGGKGFSEGTQSLLRFLPERQTDFIFATIAEGLGFVGTSIVIIAILFFCYRIYRIFICCDDRFTKIFAACTFSYFLIQGFVNIAMNVGFLPIVGVTLPFVSFGGSSLLSSFIFLGILSSLAQSARNNQMLEIR
jgi:rod shape determining protein RodA